MKAVISSILLFASLVACDPVPPPADLPPSPPVGCGAEGQMFGPCAVAHTCAEEHLGCVELAEGAACLPVQPEPSAHVQACAASIGQLACSAAFNLCGIICPSGQDSECKTGMVCDDQTHLCVWPGDIPPWYGTTGEPPPTPNPTTTSAG